MQTIPLNVAGPKRRIPRRAQRYSVRWPVLEINGKSAQDCWMVDVSCMGARLETPTALGPNLPVQFTVLLPDGKKQMELAGRVVWMRPVFAKSGYFHQGLQFYNTNWDLDRLAKASEG